MTTARLSELSGVPPRTLNDWVKKADESGFEALHGKKALGKAARLTAEQMDKVKEAIVDDPTKSGYLRRDGKALSDYIEKTFQLTNELFRDFADLISGKPAVRVLRSYARMTFSSNSSL